MKVIVCYGFSFDPIKFSRYIIISFNHSDNFVIYSNFRTLTFFPLLNYVSDKIPPEQS